MTQIRKILLDVDGVVADFVGGALEFHQVDNNPYALEENKGKYTLEDMCGISRSEFFGEMGYEFWLGLSLMPEAIQIFNACAEAVGSQNVCFLTSPVMTRGCLDGKRAWLNKYFPRQPYLIGNDKGFCAAPGHLLVDDADSNVNRFTAEGGRAFLVPRPWNSSHAFNGSIVSELRRWLGL